MGFTENAAAALAIYYARPDILKTLVAILLGVVVFMANK
jgi:hypothetical protein